MLGLVLREKGNLVGFGCIFSSPHWSMILIQFSWIFASLDLPVLQVCDYFTLVNFITNFFSHPNVLVALQQFEVPFVVY